MTSGDARRRRRVAFVAVGVGLASLALLAARTWVALDDPPGIDEALNLNGGPEPSRWTRRAMLLATMPGTAKGSFLIAITVLVVGWLLARDYRPGALVSAALTCTWATVEILKPLVDRASPRAAASAAAAHGVSFPSAHVARAAVVLGVLALVWRWGSAWLVAAVRVVAGLAVAGVALSRLVLEFHWFTDVLAGLAVAGLWTAMTIPVAEALGSSGPVSAARPVGTAVPPLPRRRAAPRPVRRDRARGSPRLPTGDPTTRRWR